MAGYESSALLQRDICAAACADTADVSAEALGLLAEALPTLSRSLYRADLNVDFLSDTNVPYDTAANLFAAIKPASATETAAFLCRPDTPDADVARIVASERRVSALRQVAELPGRDSAVYEAAVSAFGKARQTKSSRSGFFAVLSALLTNPDVPLASKAAALAVPSVSAWEGCPTAATPANSCWWALRSSEELRAAAFDGLQLPDRALLHCASWQCLTAAQLRVVFAALQRHEASCRADSETSLSDVDRIADWNDPDRLPDCLWELSDHVAATGEFLTELDDWFDKVRFDPSCVRADSFFSFTFRKNRRQKQRVAPTEFWSTHPNEPLEELTLLDWSYWTRIGSVPDLVAVLTVNLDGWCIDGAPQMSSRLVSSLTPLMSSASSADLLAGLDVAAATGMPEVVTVVEDLCWTTASYEALTFEVLRRLRLPVTPSSQAAMRLLELFAATLGPDPDLWQVFETVSTPAATVGEILDSTTQILEPDSL